MREIPRFLPFLGAACLAIGVVAASGPQSAVPARFEFRDDHDGRRLAEIRVQVIVQNGQRNLQITVAATGQDIDPIPGYTGVRGANRYTAEQFESILSGRTTFLVRTQADDGTAPWFGRWRAGRRGTLPQRRLGAEGRIDAFAETARAYPLELIVETGGAVDGAQTTELWFDGVPRLRVAYVIMGNQARVTGFHSLAEKAPASPIVLNAERPAKTPLQQERFKLPVAEADWKERDLEGKWMIFQKIIAEDDDERTKAFVRELGVHKEYALLETIALSVPGYQGSVGAAWALARADAPQWLRVAAWLRRTDFDHNEAETSKILRKHNPAKSMAWLEKYGEQAGMIKSTSPIGGDNLFIDLQALKKGNIKAGELGDALPPLQSAQVFRLLDAPKDLQTFGNRKREPGKTYVHQVVRTIDAWVQSQKYQEPWPGKVRELTRHANIPVRQAAYLSFTHFARQLPAKDNPVDEFRQVMDNPRENPAVREAAFYAFSYCSHPYVYVRLHELALQTDHLAWRAAVSRAYDLYDEFTYEHLGRIDVSKLAEKDAAMVTKYRSNLKQWLEDPLRQPDTNYKFVEARLEHAAMAKYKSSSIADHLNSWTKGDLGKSALERAHLEKAARDYSPRDAIADPAEFTRLVRELAREILAERKRK